MDAIRRAAALLAASPLALLPTLAEAQAGPASSPNGQTVALRDIVADDVASMVQPEFPLKAARAGIERGYVEARLHLDGDGRVVSIDVLGSYPTGAFDRAATSAMMQWRFRKGEPGRKVEVMVDFNLMR